MNCCIHSVYFQCNISKIDHPNCTSKIINSSRNGWICLDRKYFSVDKIVKIFDEKKNITTAYVSGRLRMVVRGTVWDVRIEKRRGRVEPGAGTRRHTAEKLWSRVRAQAAAAERWQFTADRGIISDITARNARWGQCGAGAGLQRVVINPRRCGRKRGARQHLAVAWDRAESGREARQPSMKYTADHTPPSSQHLSRSSTMKNQRWRILFYEDLHNEECEAACTGQRWRPHSIFTQFAVCDAVATFKHLLRWKVAARRDFCIQHSVLCFDTASTFAWAPHTHTLQWGQ